MTITYGSVCSGIEAATVAWHPLGMRADWLAEIEPFPSAVLAHHYPDTPNHGDMTKLAALVLARKIQAPDVLVGGTPCQAFSVAGMREGLSDPRGALTIKYVELADAIDYVRALDRKPPAVTVWENVPGVLSDKGNAFGCFLGALAGEDCELQPPGKRWQDAGCVYGPKRTIAWRILDAQYFGLAQRRRRVFVVASARDGFDPASVLFEREGLRRDTAPRRDQGEEVAGTIASRTGSGGFPGTDEACSGYLQGVDLRNGSITGDVTHTVQAGHHAPDPGGTPHVIAIHGTQDPDIRINQAHTLGRNSGQENAIFCREVAQTITSNYGKQLDNTNSALGPNVVTHAIQAGALRTNPESGPDGVGVQADHAYTLEARAEVQAVQIGLSVRRLMPKECERLQGFPDDYTLIPWPVTTDSTGSQCAKQVVRATVKTAQGRYFVSSNYVEHAPNGGCPRSGMRTGEGYELCREVCGQRDHAEINALRLAGAKAKGGRLFIEGHTYACEPCRQAAVEAGIIEIVIGAPPVDDCPDGPRYKAIGNSKAVPVVRWIGKRLISALSPDEKNG